MKKKSRKRIRKAVKPFVNFPRWAGFSFVAGAGRAIYDTAREFGLKKKDARTETFEEAMKRLKLTEQDIQHRIKTCKTMTLVYCLGALGLLGYMVHLLLLGHWVASFISLLLSGLALIFAYRESFWAFQMKTRRLGCSFNDWLDGLLGRGK